MTGLSFVLGAGYLALALWKVPSVRKERLLLVILVGFFVSLYGGSVIPFIWRAMRSDPSFSYLGSGRYFHSAFLAVLLYGLLAFRWMGCPVKKGLDHYAIAAIGMSAIGRIGCFLQGCCRGKPTGLLWAVEFPDNPGVFVHPVQLYMLWMEIALFALLFRFNRRKRYDGQTFWVGVCLYSIYRIWIETLRINPIFAWQMTHAQFFSVGTFVLSSFVLIRNALRRNST
jgi:phosphatidylglycerol---prolipoprotein diacylglyceryl transferase